MYWIWYDHLMEVSKYNVSEFTSNYWNNNADYSIRYYNKAWDWYGLDF